MWFQNSTPQSVGAYIAMQEARIASKRKSAHDSDVQPSTQKQKLFHNTLPPATASAQPQAHASTYLRPTDERSKFVGASLAPDQAQLQAHELINLGPSKITKERKADHRSIASARGHDVVNYELAMQKSELDHGSLPPAPAPAHDVTDLGPAAKKQKLSYDSLPPARVWPSSEDRARAQAEFNRRLLERWCKFYGFDYGLLKVPDTLLMSPNFDVHKYMIHQSSRASSGGYGPQEADAYRLGNSSTENLMAESQSLDAPRAPEQELGDLSYHPLASSDRAAQVCPVFDEGYIHHSPAQGPIGRGSLGSKDETTHPPSVQNTAFPEYVAIGGKNNEACPLFGDQTSTLLSSINSTLTSPVCSFSDPNVGYSITPLRSDQTTEVGSHRDIGDGIASTSSDQIAPLFLYSDSRDDTKPASSSPNASVDPPRNKGGRPRSGRKPRAFKTPKGPTRLQKNHPVKAKVDVYIWENILTFCPPDFLLKARSISSTFRSLLKENSPIWERARLNHFGPDMPNPPLGLSEPQYADLVTGVGCQTRGCTSKKTRKTYWALQKRLCVDCFEKSFVPVSILG